jgi:hypothetical protein
VVKCKVVTKGSKQQVKCTSNSGSARSRALVSIVRDHTVVAHAAGHLGGSLRLQHAAPLHGRYTLFVEIPGVTTSSQKIRIS